MTTPQDGQVIAVTTDAQGNWVKPDYKDMTWTHAWGSDGLLWNRQDWENEEKKQKNWYHKAGGANPESGGDLDNTWEGLPTGKIQQYAREDSTGKSVLPLNSTGNFRVFHERAPGLPADATTSSPSFLGRRLETRFLRGFLSFSSFSEVLEDFLSSSILYF